MTNLQTITFICSSLNQYILPHHDYKMSVRFQQLTSLLQFFHLRHTYTRTKVTCLATTTTLCMAHRIKGQIMEMECYKPRILFWTKTYPHRHPNCPRTPPKTTSSSPKIRNKICVSLRNARERLNSKIPDTCLTQYKIRRSPNAYRQHEFYNTMATNAKSNFLTMPHGVSSKALMCPKLNLATLCSNLLS